MQIIILLEYLSIQLCFSVTNSLEFRISFYTPNRVIISLGLEIFDWSKKRAKGPGFRMKNYRKPGKFHTDDSRLIRTQAFCVDIAFFFSIHCGIDNAKLDMKHHRIFSFLMVSILSISIFRIGRRHCRFRLFFAPHFEHPPQRHPEFLARRHVQIEIHGVIRRLHEYVRFQGQGA